MKMKVDLYALAFKLTIGCALIELLVILPASAYVVDCMVVAGITLSVFLLIGVIFLGRVFNDLLFEKIDLFMVLFRVFLLVLQSKLIFSETYIGEVPTYLISFFSGSLSIKGIVTFLLLLILYLVTLRVSYVNADELQTQVILNVLPKKHMALDEEVNRGEIDEEEALIRRTIINKRYINIPCPRKYSTTDTIILAVFITISLIGTFLFGVLQGELFGEESIQIIASIMDCSMCYMISSEMMCISRMILDNSYYRVENEKEINRILNINGIMLLIYGGILLVVGIISLPNYLFWESYALVNFIGGLNIIRDEKGHKLEETQNDQ